MKELLEKISSYNIFNYLLPGTIFVFLTKGIIGITIPQDNLVVAAFLNYFLGLIVSRFGSLTVEPILLKLSFVKFSPYNDYLNAVKIDPKIEILLEANNMYRTLLSLLIVLLILSIYGIIARKLCIPNEWSFYITVFFLCFIFLFSFKKQTEFIVERIEKSKNAQ